jgi:hypothetical protein
MEDAVGNRQQRWSKKDSDEAKGDDAAKEPEVAEHHGQVIGLAEDVGSDEIVNAAGEEQAPRCNEDAPPKGSLDAKP